MHQLGKVYIGQNLLKKSVVLQANRLEPRSGPTYVGIIHIYVGIVHIYVGIILIYVGIIHIYVGVMQRNDPPLRSDPWVIPLRRKMTQSPYSTQKNDQWVNPRPLRNYPWVISLRIIMMLGHFPTQTNDPWVIPQRRVMCLHYMGSDLGSSLFAIALKY